jgi:hypothetical protein
VPKELSAWASTRRLEDVSWLPRKRDQRIGRHLQDGDPRRHHEQRRQEIAIDAMRRRRREQKAARHGHQQAGHDGTHIADFFQKPGGGKGHHEIGGEKGELGQRRLGIIELEQALQLGQKRVHQHGGKAPGEEQGHHKAHQPGGDFRRALGATR